MFGCGGAATVAYPLVVEVRRSARGCHLVLSDGRTVEAGLDPETLAERLGSLGYPPLHEACGRGRAQDIDLPVTMLMDEWAEVSLILRASAVAGPTFRGHPALVASLALPYHEVVRLPMRLYGGIEPAEYGVKASLYLSPPVDFALDANRGGRWYYVLLSGTRGRLFKTWIELASARVEIESGEAPGHWVEDAAEPQRAPDTSRESC